MELLYLANISEHSYASSLEKRIHAHSYRGLCWKNFTVGEGGEGELDKKEAEQHKAQNNQKSKKRKVLKLKQ